MTTDRTAAVDARRMQREWRAHASTILLADRPARYSFWRSRSRAEVLDEIARLAPSTKRETFEHFRKSHLVAIVLHGTQCRILDLVNAGRFGAATAELERRPPTSTTAGM